MLVHDVAEKLNSNIALVIFNTKGKHIYGGDRSSCIKHAGEDILNAEVQELSTTLRGDIMVTID